MNEVSNDSLTAEESTQPGHVQIDEGDEANDEASIDRGNTILKNTNEGQRRSRGNQTEGVLEG